MLQFTLSNGIRCIAEKLPHLHSISMGVWVNVGSANESESENGLSHFIEHLVFKGTSHRSAKQIAEEMDDIGASLNAFTGKNCTCYYVRALEEHLEQSIELLWDLVYNPLFDETEMNKERGVVLEEISMSNDTPDDLVVNLAAEAIYQGSLSKPILGTYSNISNYTRDDIVQYWKKHYTPQNMVISIVGNFDEEQLRAIINKYFTNCPNTDRNIELCGNVLRLQNKALDKVIEQSHIILSYPAFEIGNSKEYAANIACNILGGGMSSRIFQKIREELGLAYSVYSYISSYKEVGTLQIYAGTNPKTCTQIIAAIQEEIQKFMHNGITEKEFLASKAQLKASLEFGLESSSSRMSRLGRGMLLRGEVKPIETILTEIANTTMENVHAVIQECFVNKASIAIVGPNATQHLEQIHNV